MGLLKRFGLWILLILLITIGFLRLRFDVDVLNLLPPDQPTVQGLKLHQRHFANARELIMTMRAPDAEKLERLAGWVARRLNQETNLIENVSWQPPWMDNPGQLAELLSCLWLNQPPEIFGALTNRLAPDRLKLLLMEAKEVLATSLSPLDIARRAFDPFDLSNTPGATNAGGFSMDEGQKVFASDNGMFRLLFIQSRLELADYVTCSRWLSAVKAVVAELRNENPEWGDVVIRYTGRPVFMTEIASSMQSDLSGSIVGTSAIIALLFWLTHRRWIPMLWLLVLLAAILGATLALGGLALGTINVVSLGFAAVLLGLAVDYAVVHYQEAMSHPQMSVKEIRRVIAPSILWAAITTICAFLVLNFGGLPGLAQLGTLVAIGVALAALVMVMLFLPPLFPARLCLNRPLKPMKWRSYFVPPLPPLASKDAAQAQSFQGASLLATALILLVAGAILYFRLPGLDDSGNALRPKMGEAETALNEMTALMGIPRDALWLIVSGRRESNVYRSLCQAEVLLDGARSNGVIQRYVLPTALWPRPEFQDSNRAAARVLGGKGPLLSEAIRLEGFTTNAMFLTEEMLSLWKRAGNATEVIWPTNQTSQWLFKRFMARTTNEWLVMGLVYPATNRSAMPELEALSSRLSEDQVLLAGWELLGTTTLRRVQDRFWLVVTPMVFLVLASLWCAFYRVQEVLLGMAVMLMSGLCVLALMALVGWSWNLLNIMALPLMLGTGVDYSIFIQQALRRHAGNRGEVRNSVGRALLLCGATAIAGFGSLAWSSYPGMASLGKVCAAGIGANMLISVFLLPHWWTFVCMPPHPRSGNNFNKSEAKVTPPAFYRAGLWRMGLCVVRLLPARLVNGLFILASEAHFHSQRRRREIVVRNLLPACGGDRLKALKTTRKLYHNFGRKLADLWRVESGQTVKKWRTHPGELEIIRNACERGQGVLLLTLHLGNWEHGGLLLAQQGIPLTVLTLAEPDQRLTEIRTASRARWGIDTLIIGQDGFAFLEVIQRLQAGAVLAMALDRPPPRNHASVHLFGMPFHAPLAAAELARATGCALVGVTIVRESDGFAVKALPEFAYSRQSLGNRLARQELTQQILRAFEPEIRQNLDQWYQFIPIWPDAPSSSSQDAGSAQRHENA